MRLALFLVLALGAVAYAAWVYTRVELPVPSRKLLAALRALSLVILLALLADPMLPASGSGDPGRRWVLLDRSLSMDGVWSEAEARAAALQDEGWTVVAFGDGLDFAVTSLQELRPDAVHTRLASALQRAAEAGATAVTVLSDGRFEDPVGIEAALRGLPLPVSFEILDAPGPNAGVSRLGVADAARQGDLRGAVVEIHGSGADSARVELREEGSLVASATVALPAPGFRRTVELQLPPASGAGRTRFTATARVDGDRFPSDDEGVAYALSGSREAALVLVSLEPDWEPRYLLPVLEQATGLRASGFLRVGSDRFVPMGRAVDRGVARDSAAVAAAAAEAALLVVHGLDGRPDGWSRSLLSSGRGRTLVIPSGNGGAAVAGVPVGSVRTGEWYVSPMLPASSLAGELSGRLVQDLPPLSDVIPLADGRYGEVPLHVQLAGTGTGEAALVLTTGDGGRRAVTLAKGFWRWAARGGSAREAYLGLWSGVAGWLLGGDADRQPQEVRPAKWVFARGEAASFLVPPAADLPLSLRIENGAGEATIRTIGDRDDPGAVHLDPGPYGYVVTGPGGASLGSGRFDVESRTGEMASAVFSAPGGGGTEGAAGVMGSRGRPLRTMMWPYLLIITLLSAEWIGRRRAGLR